MKVAMSTKKITGVTLLEMIIVLVLLSVIALAGVRMFDSYDSSVRFQGTLDRMGVIRDKIIGDERIVQSGRRVDFGYFGKHAVFPGGGGLDLLASVWKSCDPYLLAHDAWGRRLDYNGPGGSGGAIAIRSPGENGSYGADTGFNKDIVMSLNIAHYTANNIYIYCKDVNGTILRGIINTSAPTHDYHIREVTFIQNGGGTYSYTSTGVNSLSYGRWGYWYKTGVINAGQCVIKVFPADGDGAKNCNTNRLPELLAEGLIAVEVHEVVYPKGGFANNNDNVFIIRFPGAVGELHP